MGFAVYVKDAGNARTLNQDKPRSRFEHLPGEPLDELLHHGGVQVLEGARRVAVRAKRQRVPAGERTSRCNRSSQAGRGRGSIGLNEPRPVLSRRPNE